MNNDVQATMRQELAQSRTGLGFFVGLACFVLLAFLAQLIPGVDVLMKSHDWPGVVLLAVSAFVGWITGSMRKDSIRREIEQYDDDTLKFNHDKMSRKKLKSDVIFYIIVAIVLGYFLLRR